MFAQRVLVALKRVVTALSPDSRSYLFGKIGVDNTPDNWGLTSAPQEIDALNAAADPRLVALCEDILQNRQYYRASVAPRYLFDVPWDDLQRFLRLDGWEQTTNGALRKTENEIINAPVEEDALFQRLRASTLPNAALVETHLNRAADEYGRDNNNSMTNSRQALEQILADIATVTAMQRGDTLPERVRDYLQECGFLTEEEKRGFSGAYGFLSGGPHPGIVDQEAARLGRNFSLGSCQYALQKYERWSANDFRGF